MDHSLNTVLRHERLNPVILPKSPGEQVNQINITGYPRVIRDAVADIYNNIQAWNDQHLAGASIIQNLAVLLPISQEEFSKALETQIMDIHRILLNLDKTFISMNSSMRQLSSLVKLQKIKDPPFMMMSIEQIAKIAEEIVDAYQLELKAKEYVYSNIAFSSTKQEVMFFAACWAHQINITSATRSKLEALLIETGLRKII